MGTMGWYHKRPATRSAEEVRDMKIAMPVTDYGRLPVLTGRRSPAGPGLVVAPHDNDIEMTL
jgi:hypothetical protein